MARPSSAIHPATATSVNGRPTTDIVTSSRRVPPDRRIAAGKPAPHAEVVAPGLGVGDGHELVREPGTVRLRRRSPGGPPPTKKPERSTRPDWRGGCADRTRRCRSGSAGAQYQGAGTRAATATATRSRRATAALARPRDRRHTQHDHRRRPERPERPRADELREAERQAERQRDAEPVVGPASRRAASTSAAVESSIDSGSGWNIAADLKTTGEIAKNTTAARCSISRPGQRSRTSTRSNSTSAEPPRRVSSWPTRSGWSSPSRLPSSSPTPPTAKKPGRRVVAPRPAAETAVHQASVA